MLLYCGEQTVQSVLGGFDINAEAESFELGRGDRTNRGELRPAGIDGVRRNAVEKRANGRGAGERQPVDAAGGNVALQLLRVTPERDGSVNGDIVNGGPGLGEQVGGFFRCGIGTEQQNLLVSKAGRSHKLQGQLAACENVRDKIGIYPEFTKFFCGGGSDGSDFGRGEDAAVLVKACECGEKYSHAVGAGEDDPIVLRDFGERLDECGAVGQRSDFDRRKLDRITAAPHNHRGELGIAAGVTGDDDVLSEERPCHKPVEPRVTLCGSTNDDNSGRLDTLPSALFGYSGKGSFCNFLGGEGCVGDYGGGRVGVSAVFDEVVGDEFEVAYAHIEYDGAGEFGEGGPVDFGFGFVVGFAAGDKHDLRRVVSVGEDDSGGGGCCCGGGDAGDDFEIDAGLGQYGELFGCSAEDAGVAALEADDGFSGGGFFEEEPVDFVLGGGAWADSFGYVDDFGIGRGEFEQGGICELVIDYTVGGSQQLCAADSNQIRVAGSGANEVNPGFCLISHKIPFKNPSIN